MKCASCQAALAKTDKFCKECGAKNPAFKSIDERVEELEKANTKKTTSVDDEL